jgi:peptidoglycan-associated lipoprotein
VAKAAPAPAPAVVMIPAYLDPNSPISKERSVFFEYDNYTIKTEFNGMVQRHGEFLAKNPNVLVKVEGNADERGGREYNLALGQKRAEAVVKALKIYGVKDSQVEAVSLGKEKPKAMGHDEAAWSQNRRVDLQYPSK